MHNLKLISCFTLFLLIGCKTYPPSYSDSFTLPLAIKSAWIQGVVFNGEKAHKVVNVTISEFGKINDDVKGISKISRIPMSKLTSELYFSLPGESTRYSLPVNDSSFDFDHFRPYYDQIANGIDQEVTLVLGIYRRKGASGTWTYIWLIEKLLSAEPDNRNN